MINAFRAEYDLEALLDSDIEDFLTRFDGIERKLRRVESGPQVTAAHDTYLIKALSDRCERAKDALKSLFEPGAKPSSSQTRDPPSSSATLVLAPAADQIQARQAALLTQFKNLGKAAQKNTAEAVRKGSHSVKAGWRATFPPTVRDALKQWQYLITGNPGIGKSTLALQLAMDLQKSQEGKSRYPWGTYLVKFSSPEKLGSQEHVLVALKDFLAALGVKKSELPDSQDQAVARIAQLLQGIRCLVLVDGASEAAALSAFRFQGDDNAQQADAEALLQLADGCMMAVLSALQANQDICTYDVVDLQYMLLLPPLSADTLGLEFEDADHCLQTLCNRHLLSRSEINGGRYSYRLHSLMSVYLGHAPFGNWQKFLDDPTFSWEDACREDSSSARQQLLQQMPLAFDFFFSYPDHHPLELVMLVGRLLAVGHADVTAAISQFEIALPYQTKWSMFCMDDEKADRISLCAWLEEIGWAGGRGRSPFLPALRSSDKKPGRAPGKPEWTGLRDDACHGDTASLPESVRGITVISNSE
ncbi:hypothetical protein WJX73_006744 [Symbiochloris irregularis]|uniref:NACHT domain-containing protein n=1 Tax=Symbiochloris irregularis TaxID=706552 RepID=A0AAW1NQC1_9CHLO